MVATDVERETAEPRVRNTFTDLQAEDNLVVSLFLEPSRVARAVQGKCERTDFSNRELGDLFACMLVAASANRVVRGGDGVAWIEAIRKAGGKLDPAFARRMNDAQCFPVHAEYYANRIARLSQLRRIANATEAMRDALTDESEPADVVGNLEAYVRQIAAGGHATNARTLTEAWKDVAEEFVELSTRDEEPAILSGIADCDRIGFVFVPGELSILAARPGCGKTTLATQVLMHHAHMKGRPVMFASLEMSERELATRTLCQEAEVNHQALRSSQVTPEAANRLREHAHAEDAMPLYVWAPGRVPVSQIHAQARWVQQTKGLRLLVVDYIGLVRPDNRSAPRHEQVGEITKGLRDIAQQLKIPVLALCQLNREADKQRPTLSNLKESGDIEQDADVVAFIHRADVANAKSDDKVEFIVAKNRHGSPNWCPLSFDGMAGKFLGHNALTDGNPAFANWNQGGSI